MATLPRNLVYANDGEPGITRRKAGRKWARETMELAKNLRRHPFVGNRVKSAAAIDAEPAWDRSFHRTRDFFKGFRSGFEPDEKESFEHPLLYTVALHRYLRWRLPEYDPERNLAGVLYLFVRGMVGADTPAVDGTPCGVFAWRPPAAVVEELSDVLDRGSAA